MKIFDKKAQINVKNIPLILFRADKSILFFTIQYRNGEWWVGYIDPEYNQWVQKLTYQHRDMNEINNTFEHMLQASVYSKDAKYFVNCPADVDPNITYDKSDVEFHTPDRKTLINFCDHLWETRRINITQSEIDEYVKIGG